jgi:hypothetical protein
MSNCEGETYQYNWSYRDCQNDLVTLRFRDSVGMQDASSAGFMPI